MKIVDVIKESALLLGLVEEEPFLKEITEENEAELLSNRPKIATLFNLIKFSIRELCTNYVPVKTKEKVFIQDKKYPVSALKNYIRIQSLEENSQLIKYKLINREIVVEKPGEYVVNYLTYPEINSMLDEIDFLSHLSPDVIVLGLCSYYALTYGMFEDFKELNAKYVQKAESLKTLKIFELPARRWE